MCLVFFDSHLGAFSIFFYLPELSLLRIPLGLPHSLGTTIISGCGSVQSFIVSFWRAHPLTVLLQPSSSESGHQHRPLLYALCSPVGNGVTVPSSGQDLWPGWGIKFPVDVTHRRWTKNLMACYKPTQERYRQSTSLNGKWNKMFFFLKLNNLQEWFFNCCSYYYCIQFSLDCFDTAD